METKENQRRGVSLIVLVITIIVIIILAAAVILSLNNNNPITNAKKASFQSDVQNFNDELNLYIADQYARNMGVLDLNTINGQEAAMNTYISSIKPKYHTILEVQNGKLVVKSTATGDEKIWAEEILGGTTTSGGGTLTPGEPVDTNKTFDGKPGSATNPIIPKGFAPINTATSTWQETADGVSKGLVIEDKTGDSETNGNQFVWIPVPEFSKFKRQDWNAWSGTGEPADISSSYTEESGDGTASVTEAEKMYKSVKDNQGFYIARYEAGKPESGKTKAVSKASRDVWNYMNWTDSDSNSKAMYPSTNENVGVTSTLIYSVQWDAAMRWMKDIKNTEDNTKLYLRDSTGMGNYSEGGGLKQTGETNEVNNIYDLAGNVSEWTMEFNVTDFVSRGGDYTSSGIFDSVPHRGIGGMPPFVSDLDGFRSTLYIKNK